MSLTQINSFWNHWAPQKSSFSNDVICLFIGPLSSSLQLKQVNRFWLNFNIKVYLNSSKFGGSSHKTKNQNFDSLKVDCNDFDEIVQKCTFSWYKQNVLLCFIPASFVFRQKMQSCQQTNQLSSLKDLIKKIKNSRLFWFR